MTSRMLVASKVAEIASNIALFAFSDANKMIYDELMRMMAQNLQNGDHVETGTELPPPDVLPNEK